MIGKINDQILLYTFVGSEQCCAELKCEIGYFFKQSSNSQAIGYSSIYHTRYFKSLSGP